MSQRKNQLIIAWKYDKLMKQWMNDWMIESLIKLIDEWMNQVKQTDPIFPTSLELINCRWYDAGEKHQQRIEAGLGMEPELRYQREHKLYW